MRYQAVIVVKEHRLGCLSFVSDGVKAVAGNFNNTLQNIFIKEYDTAEAGLADFNQAVESSVERGWRVVYRGQPNWG